MIRKLLLASLLPAAAVLALGLLAPASALASSTPRVQADNTGWSGMSVEPANFYFGNGEAPYITGLRWSRWTTSGKATGKLHKASGGTYYSYAATTWLNVIKTHDGQPYFYQMIIDYAPHGDQKHVVLKFRTDGGSMPAWVGWPS